MSDPRREAPTEAALRRVMEEIGARPRRDNPKGPDADLARFPKTALAVAAWRKVRAAYQKLRPDDVAKYTDADGTTSYFMHPQSMGPHMAARAEREGDAAVALDLGQYVAELRELLPSEVARIEAERAEEAADRAWESQAYVYPYPPPRSCRSWVGRLVWLYHGTTTKRLKAILREGIRPDVPKARRLETAPGRAFVTANGGGSMRSGQAPGAGMYAQRAAEQWGGDPVVLRVIVPWSVLSPDSDDADLSCADYQWETASVILPEQVMEVDGVRRRAAVGRDEAWCLGHAGPREADRRENPRGRLAWMHETLPGRLRPTPKNVAAARRFLLEKWRERAAERGVTALPDDLTGSCKFSSRFASLVFGGRLRGNWDHQYVELPDGSVLDLNEGASDVVRLGARAHRHDRTFWDNPEHRDDMRCNEARAQAWAEEFLSARRGPSVRRATNPGSAAVRAAKLADFLSGSLYKEPVFHGSSVAGLTRLRPDMGTEYGVFLSPRRAYAARHGSVVYRAYVNIRRPLLVADKSEISPRDLTRQDAERIAQQGYDAVVSGAHEIVVFDGSRVMLSDGF